MLSHHTLNSNHIRGLHLPSTYSQSAPYQHPHAHVHHDRCRRRHQVRSLSGPNSGFSIQTFLKAQAFQHQMLVIIYRTSHPFPASEPFPTAQSAKS
ncbi:hypothetical protein OIU76_007724, partial [Salix suchowensis]